MSLNVIYQLTTLVCLWQVATASAAVAPGAEQSRDGIFDGIIQTALKQAEAVVAQIESQILAVAQTAQSSAQSGQVQFNNESAIVVEETQQQASSSVQQANTTLAKWQALAQAQHVDVSNCLQQQQGLATLPQQLQRCVEAGGTAVHQVSAQLNSSLQAAGGWRQLQQAQLQDCLSAPLTAVVCLASCVTQATSEGQRVVAELQNQAQQLQQSTSSAISSVQACVGSEAQSAVASFQQTASAVQQCIASKLPGASTSVP